MKMELKLKLSPKLYNIMLLFSISIVTDWMLKHYILTICAGVFFRYVIVVFNKDSGDVTKSTMVDTTQSRDEIAARNKSAMESYTGESFKTRKTRGGWSNESDSWFVSGQKVKNKK